MEEEVSLGRSGRREGVETGGHEDGDWRGASDNCDLVLL